MSLRSLRLILALVVALGGASVTALAGSAGNAQWRTLEPTPLARTEVAGGRVGGAIWIVGGFGSGGVPSAEVERYDPRTRNWTLMPPLPVTLNHTAVFGYRGRAYVFGGFENLPAAGLGPVSSRLLRFRPSRGEWEDLAPSPTPRAAFAVGRIGRHVFVAGGSTDAATKTTRLDVYDLRRDRWQRGPDLEVAREHLAGAVAGTGDHKFFYAIGGRDVYGSPNYSTVERYNPRTRRWRRLPDTGTAHGGFGAVGVGRRVIAVGGEAPGSSPSGTIADAEIYLPRRKRWRPLPDMPTARHGLGVAASGGRVFAIEGGTVTSVGVSNVVERLRVRR